MEKPFERAYNYKEDPNYIFVKYKELFIRAVKMFKDPNEEYAVKLDLIAIDTLTDKQIEQLNAIIKSKEELLSELLDDSRYNSKEGKEGREYNIGNWLKVKPESFYSELYAQASKNYKAIVNYLKNQISITDVEFHEYTAETRIKLNAAARIGLPLKLQVCITRDDAKKLCEHVEARVGKIEITEPEHNYTLGIRK